MQLVFSLFLSVRKNTKNGGSCGIIVRPEVDQEKVRSNVKIGVFINENKKILVILG
jgi:hypothetical protein